MSIFDLCYRENRPEYLHKKFEYGVLDLSFVELNMNLPQYQAECLENIPYLKSLQEQYQIGYTIHLDENLNVCDFNKAVAKAYTDTVVRTIQVAKALEVPVLNMHMRI
ncbi:MAG: hypothetical protein K2O16_12320 [Lachnospiraceae bacterium]|nr:hypothetical protein [Lachnospiraceae bacterium]